jgi:hypothetical protein
MAQLPAEQRQTIELAYFKGIYALADLSGHAGSTGDRQRAYAYGLTQTQVFARNSKTGLALE